MIFIFLFFSQIAFAVSEVKTCILIEGLNLGCVPSIDHSCKINRAVSGKAMCTYASGWGTRTRVEGPIAFQCKTQTSTEVCTTTPGTSDTGPGRSCVTVSNCVEYFQPSCDEQCIGCYENVVQANIGRYQGCIICTRPKCGDEPDAGMVCPPSHNGLPYSGPVQRCDKDHHCPTSAKDPNGVSHSVNIRVAKCELLPPELPKPPQVLPPKCPWKTDRRSENGCEPIEESNRND